MSAADTPTGSFYIQEIAQLRGRIRELEAKLQEAVDGRAAIARDYRRCAEDLAGETKRANHLESELLRMVEEYNALKMQPQNQPTFDQRGRAEDPRP